MQIYFLPFQHSNATIEIDIVVLALAGNNRYSICHFSYFEFVPLPWQMLGVGTNKQLEILELCLSLSNARLIIQNLGKCYPPRTKCCSGGQSCQAQESFNTKYDRPKQDSAKLAYCCWRSRPLRSESFMLSQSYQSYRSCPFMCQSLVLVRQRKPQSKMCFFGVGCPPCPNSCRSFTACNCSRITSTRQKFDEFLTCHLKRFKAANHAIESH